MWRVVDRTWLLVLALSVSGALALFEDQAGTYDWYHQHIGIVSGAVFHPSKPRVCVATAQNVLGCLTLRDGSIAWRKLLSNNNGLPLTALVQPQSLVAASAGFLHSYDLEGNLKWQRKLLSSAAPLLFQFSNQRVGIDGGAILAVQGTSIQAFAAVDGAEVLKSRDLLALGKSNVVAAAAGDAVYILAYDTGSQEAGLVELQDVAGKLTGKTLQSPMRLSKVVAASGDSFAVLSEDRTALCVALMRRPTAAFNCQPVSTLAPAMGSPSEARLVGTSAGYVLLSRNGGGGAAVLGRGDDGSLKLLQHCPSAIGVSGEIAADGGHVIGLVAQSPDGGLTLLVTSSNSGSVVHEEAFPVIPSAWHLIGDAQPMEPTTVALGTFRKKDKGVGFRAVVSFAGGVTAMLQQSVVVWSRDESLAAIKDTIFVDLPARSANGTALSGIQLDLETRIRYQVLGAKIQLKLNSPEEAASYLQLRNLLSDKNTPIRDVNGFRKLLLALTATGRVAALHSGDGRVLWGREFPSEAMPTRLLPWRGFHDIQHAPEVLLLREVQPGPYAMVLNAHSGELLWRMELPYCVRDVVPLHTPLHEGSAFQSLYLLVEEGAAPSPSVHLLPDTAVARAHFAAMQRSSFVLTRGQESNSLRGFRLSLEQGSAGAISVAQVWQMDLPDSILATAVSDPTEPTQSSVKVLSDRTIKYKYLNPNLLFVATGLPAGAAASNADASSLSAEVTVHLVDTVTGRVLHRQSHAGARGPVTAALTENMVLYFYRDIESGRHVACSMELFDATAGREFSVLDYLFNPNSTRPISSFSPMPVEVLTQSFFSRIAPTAVAVTRTEQGITSKQYLLVTNTDQVYALDRRWVDPRRPKKQKLTQEEMEEGLVPYQDTLPLSPLSFATLDKQVLGIRGVTVEPTRLESTCLMFVHGLDVFFTRLAPAKGFDSLEDDFNYALLLAALIGLAAGSVMLGYMAKQTALKQKWK